MTDSCFQLKGSVFTAVVMELHHYSSATFARELEQKIEQAPQLLLQSPIVFNLDKCAEEAVDLDFNALIQQCRDFGLQPIGFRSSQKFNRAIAETGLAILPQTTGRAGNTVGARSSQEAQASPPEPQSTVVEKPVRVPSKIITQPVRSGQQIYARDTDLIVMSQVSEGAEVIADGNIHIYGGLRGRALAGVNGDVTASIFCRNMEAEMLSIAGNFMLSEDFREPLRKQSVHAYLKEENLCIDLL